MPSLFLLLGRWSFCCSSQHLRGNEVVMNRFFQAGKLLEKTLSARKNIIGNITLSKTSLLGKFGVGNYIPDCRLAPFA